MGVYEKQEWKDYPSMETPVTADRLNHMEEGIYEASIKKEAIDPDETNSIERKENGLYVPKPKEIDQTTVLNLSDVIFLDENDNQISLKDLNIRVKKLENPGVDPDENKEIHSTRTVECRNANWGNGVYYVNDSTRTMNMLNYLDEYMSYSFADPAHKISVLICSNENTNVNVGSNTLIVDKHKDNITTNYNYYAEWLISKEEIKTFSINLLSWQNSDVDLIIREYEDK